MQSIKLTDKEIRVLYEHLSADLSYGDGGTFTPMNEESKRDLKKVDKEIKIAEGILNKLKY